MLASILSGLIVSIDAFFIGISLGVQKKCKYIYLGVINIFLFVLCMLGFFIAESIYEAIPFDPDIVVGFAFISLGLWTILQFFISEHIKKRRGASDEVNISIRTIAIVGFVMSAEAMLITMGITFIFLPYSSIFIPISVAFAHFLYSSIAFYLARSEKIRRVPLAISYVISGMALIIYGLMALFLEIDSLIYYIY